MARHDVGRLADELKPFSDTLRDTLNDFKDIANNFEMLSFVEQKATRLPPPELDQLVRYGFRLSRTGIIRSRLFRKDLPS